VEIAARQRGVYGARMTGGGFWAGARLIFVGRGSTPAEFSAASLGGVRIRDRIASGPSIYVKRRRERSWWKRRLIIFQKVGPAEERRRNTARLVNRMDASLLQEVPHRQVSIHLHASGVLVFAAIERSGPWLGRVEKAAPEKFAELRSDLLLVPWK